MAIFRKFWLILWKNWLFRKRQYILTFCEIILPTLFSALLLFLRNTGGSKLEKKYHSEFTEFEPESVLNLPSTKQLMYTPDSPVSWSLLKEPLDLPELFSFVVTPVANDEEMDDIALNSDPDSTMVGVSFVDLGDTLPKKLHYRIRYRLGDLDQWNTGVLLDTSPPPGPSVTYEKQATYNTGFLWLQKAIAQRFIELSAKKENLLVEEKLLLQRMPYPPYTKDSVFSQMLRTYLPLFIILSYIFVSPTLIKHIVQEKELGVKELMKLMGLPGWLQWCGWFVSAFIVMSISALIIVILLSWDWFGIHAVLPNTSPWLFLFILLLYITSSICFCFFITTFFSKPTLATAVGIFIWLLSYFVPLSVLTEKYVGMILIEKLAFMLLPNVAMTLAIWLILAFETRNESFGWSNFFDPSYTGDNLTIAIIIFMFIFDIFLYCLLTWYLDNILPSEFGVRKPWYFIFTKNYWCPSKTKPMPISSKVTRQSSLNFESDPVALVPVINMKNLTKKYGWRDTGKVAVNNISMIMYEGQITALLGHNGAGKTTTMSMLTGMFPPTSGTAYINNHNIRTDIDAARKDIGLCPQQNMLFNNFTVKEHFIFFGSLKISSSAVLKNEVNVLIQRLKLQSPVRKNTLIRNLSGGMKRKVCLGIALIGGPKVIILDEPTSGMDPEARRDVWDLLQLYKTGHCLILTTHFMEEADALADRIAIMANGQIVCCGSPIFLKNRYGAGYRLNISKEKFCDVPKITEILKKHIKGLQLASNTVNEVSFILPTDQTSSFSDAFKQLEDNMKDLGINSFGISVTTMEEVFLKVGESTGTVTGGSALVTVPQRAFIPINKNQNCALFFEQFIGMILKRWYYARRRWILLIAQVLLPVLMVVAVLQLLASVTTTPLQEPSRVLGIKQYNRAVAVITMPKYIENSYTELFPEDTKLIRLADIAKYTRTMPKYDYPSYTKNYIVGAEIKINENSGKFTATAWYNGEYYHAKPLSLNLLLNAILKYSTRSMDYSLTVENKPLPLSKAVAEKEKVTSNAAQMMLIAIFIAIGFSFLSSSFVVFPIHERATKSKHLQLMTGINGITFWAASFIWDFATHIICCVLVLIVFFLLDSTDSFTGEGKTEILCLLLLLYGWSSIPFSYLASFLTTQQATGFTRLTILNLIAGIVLSIGISVLLALTPGTIADVIQWFCRFLSTFTITMALIKMGDLSAKKATCTGNVCKLKLGGYLQWESPGIGQEIFMLALTGFLYLLILLLIEQDCMYSVLYDLNKIPGVRLRAGLDSPGKLDADVVTEKHAVNRILKRQELRTYALVVNDLTKRFGNYNAVDGLNFAIGNGECFGLLGVNGAGKTTTFEMLTGNLLLTKGNAFAFGKSLIGNRHSYLSKIGYCPQFDALIDYLTGEEMLRIFAHLRGIPMSKMGQVVNNFITNFDLKDHAHKTTRVYSGGNKRKLSAALAFIGEPPIVFLDEPTTGVDPVARRKIWDILISANSVGISVVLTSHSLDECDILCSRVGIMVSGQFRCMGGTQYLKNKFSQGFLILAKIKRLKDDEEMNGRQYNFQKYIQHHFPSAVLKDFHQGLVQYQVIDPKTKWTYLFETMEKAKVKFILEDYSISQATLEQVFLSFARKAEPAKAK